MSLRSFENYRSLASMENVTDTEVAGRYEFQAYAERMIVGDVLKKLSIGPDDELMEIGCGPGNLLIPLSYVVAQSVGIDNAAALDRLTARVGDRCQIRLYAGDFLTMELPDSKFDKVLIYSVLHYLNDTDAVIAFVSRALSLLSPGGKLLLGDLPNQDKKRRYAESPAGKAANLEWQALISSKGGHPMSQFPRDDELVAFDDDLVLSLLRLGRELRFESYLLQQSSSLPFGNTREDILYVAPK